MPTTLLKKLGIKENSKIYLHNSPENYSVLLEENYPDNIEFCHDLSSQKVDFIHFFTNSLNDLEENLPKFQDNIVENGIIWVSWHKKASKKHSEINEDIIRVTALELRLVDIKVCSVNSDWSALKLVIRKSLRKT